MEKPKWRGIVKIRMHVDICYACILAIAAHKIGRPELVNNIAALLPKSHLPQTQQKHGGKQAE